jgi:two-component system response regulator YesN
LYQFGIINTFEESFNDNYKIICITLNNKQIAFIIQDVVNDCFDIDDINLRCENILKTVQNCFGFTVTISMSMEGCGAEDLKSRFEECLNILKYKFYIGYNSIISYEDVNPFYKQEINKSFEDSFKSMIEGIRTGNEKVVIGKIDEVFSIVNGMDINKFEYIRGFYKNTIEMINNIKIGVNSTCNEVQKIEVTNKSSIISNIDECDNIDQLNEMLKTYAIKATSLVNLYNNKKIKLALKRAMDYIREHYNEQLTLSQVSENIYLSSYYISRLFKKELGKNFVDYLNEIRIDKAKELLKDIKYKSYEIAEMVGISDAHYFSKLFKKHVGMAPTEYRESITSN